MISRPIESTLVWRRKCLHINLAFDVVLRVYSLQKESALSEAEKLDMMLEMLVLDYWKIRWINPLKKSEILKSIFEKFINIKVKPAKDNVKSVDFDQDAMYIYASFKQAYGIDLQAELGRLDWREFIALFRGMPHDTKISEVMSIRTRKLPKPTKHNADEIRALQEAKAYYALEVSADEAEGNFQRDIDKLAGSLERLAKEGGTSEKRS